MKNIAKYNKFIVAFIGFIVSAALMRYGSSDPLLNDLVALLTAVGVYAIPNRQ